MESWEAHSRAICYSSKAQQLSLHDMSLSLGLLVNDLGNREVCNPQCLCHDHLDHLVNRTNLLPSSRD